MSEQIKPVAWHDMSTAPKDGTEIILENANYCRVLAHWMPGGHCIEDHPPIEAGCYFYNGSFFDVFTDPKRWMFSVQSEAVKELRNQVQQLQQSLSVSEKFLGLSNRKMADQKEQIKQLQQRNDDLSRACALMRKALNTICMETGNEKHCAIATEALMEEIKIRRSRP